jgi:hypothetical protein
MTVKTVIVCSVDRLHTVASKVMPATIKELFVVDHGVRVNLHQQEGACPEQFREWVTSTFSEKEIKSMY